MSKKYNGQKLENGLYYSDDEIGCLYKEAPDKKEQIKILMDLNLCSEDDIRSALIRSGIDGRSLPRRRKPNVPKESIQDNTDNKNTQDDAKCPPDVDIIHNTDTQPNAETIINYLKLASTALNSYKLSILDKKEHIEKDITNLELQLKKLQEELEKCNTELAIFKILSI